MADELIDKREVQQVANAIFAMFTANPGLTVYDVRRHNEQQGWSLTSDADGDGGVRAGALRLAPNELDAAWAKAKRLRDMNEFSWI